MPSRTRSTDHWLKVSWCLVAGSTFIGRTRPWGHGQCQYTAVHHPVTNVVKFSELEKLILYISSNTSNEHWLKVSWCLVGGSTFIGRTRPLSHDQCQNTAEYCSPSSHSDICNIDLSCICTNKAKKRGSDHSNEVSRSTKSNCKK